MALKDWKKTRTWKNGITFEHKNVYYNRKMVQIYKDKSFNPEWRTTYNSNGKFIDDKLSKTKSQALRFAKAYMRKH